MTPQDQWVRSLRLLREGNWDGWPAHEWIRTARIDSKDTFEVTPTYGKPIWRGERGTVLVNADFGMGDTIHFARFLPLMNEHVSKLILRCDHDLASLLDVEVVSSNDPIPECDYLTHMMALPRLFGLREFSGKPYLSPKHPLPGSIAMLDQMKFTKIGLCWAGNPANPRDESRSLPQNLLGKFEFGVPVFHLVKHLPCPKELVDFRGYMRNWNDTAHVLSRLDLVISVDTAVAHLAGALGVPTWLLLPTNPDWRWGNSGEKTCWYDSIKIFRQKDCGWEEVLDEVVKSCLTTEF